MVDARPEPCDSNKASRPYRKEDLQDSTADSMSPLAKKMQEQVREESRSTALNDQQSLATLQTKVRFEQEVKRKAFKRKEVPRSAEHQRSREGGMEDRGSPEALERAMLAKSEADSDKQSLKMLLDANANPLAWRSSKTFESRKEKKGKLAHRRGITVPELDRKALGRRAKSSSTAYLGQLPHESRDSSPEVLPQSQLLDMPSPTPSEQLRYADRRMRSADLQTQDEQLLLDRSASENLASLEKGLVDWDIE